MKKSDLVKNRLWDYCDREWEIHFTKIKTDIERSKLLCQFFVEKILPIKQFIDLSEDFEDGYVDGGGDGGCDVIIKKGDQVHIIQSKYLGSDKQVAIEDMDKWNNVFMRLTSPDEFKLKPKVKEIIKEIKWKNDKFFLWFLTNSKVQNNARVIFDSKFYIPEKLQSGGFNYEDQVISELMDEPALRELLDSENESILQQDIPFKFHTSIDDQGKPCIFAIDNGDMLSAVLAVNSNELIDLFNSTGSDLFSMNIRNPLGNVGKNKKIRETAESEPENFFFYNNGISAICTNLNIQKNIISGKGLSVVNGAQTIRSLAFAGHDPKKERKVLMRITEMPSYGTQKDLLRKITEFNNTQNSILPSDFYSNDKIQIEWEKRVKNLGLKRNQKNISYFRKRNSKEDKSGFSIDLLSLMKQAYAFIVTPYKAESRGINALFIREKDSSGNDAPSGYEVVFGDIENVTDELIIERIGIFILAYEFQQQIKNLKKQNPKPEGVDLVSLERNTILVHIANRFLTELNHLQVLDKKKFLQSLVTTKGGWNFGDENTPGELLKLLFESVLHFSREILGELIPSGRLTERQWQRGGSKEVEQKFLNISKSAWLQLLLNNIKNTKAVLKFS